MYQVLIADDETIIRKGIRCLLDWEALGYTISAEAATGKQALTAMLEERPDVVLMDLNMPDIPGLEAIRQAREAGYDGRIIILSGCSDFKYAQEAIHYNVQDYLTKPIDEDELTNILIRTKQQLDESRNATDAVVHYRQKAHDAIIRDVLTGTANAAVFSQPDLHLEADSYQVVLYEKYSYDPQDMSYLFSDLLRVTNENYHSYDVISVDNHEVLLLKGSFAIQKFNSFLERLAPPLNRLQKNSPLDTLFIAYGRCVDSHEEIPVSYQDACDLMHRRFFCEPEQHTIGYPTPLPAAENAPLLDDALLEKYEMSLLNYIQTLNRNMISETLQQLSQQLSEVCDTIDSIRLFLIDLYLRIKEQIYHLYRDAAIIFPSNADTIRFVNQQYYLYDIMNFFRDQFEIVMTAIGTSNRDSVLDNVFYYIDHNYADNITLENIAPLFGYNSSYLGKIFRKKMGQSFNSYVDQVRIEHAKELLLNENIKVYTVAERVGYCNVDYFHIKFKKLVGLTPAKYRKLHKISPADQADAAEDADSEDFSAPK